VARRESGNDPVDASAKADPPISLKKIRAFEEEAPLFGRTGYGKSRRLQVFIQEFAAQRMIPITIEDLDRGRTTFYIPKEPPTADTADLESDTSVKDSFRTVRVEEEKKTSPNNIEYTVVPLDEINRVESPAPDFDNNGVPAARRPEPDYPDRLSPFYGYQLYGSTRLPETQINVPVAESPAVPEPTTDVTRLPNGKLTNAEA